MQKQHKALCDSFQRVYATLHTGLFGEGGTIYITHVMEPLKNLGLDFERARKLYFKLHTVHFVDYFARLVHTRRALSSAQTRIKLDLPIM